MADGDEAARFATNGEVRDHEPVIARSSIAAAADRYGTVVLGWKAASLNR